MNFIAPRAEPLSHFSISLSAIVGHALKEVPLAELVKTSINFGMIGLPH